MRTSQSAANVEKALNLLKMIEQRKMIEKAEKELKDHFKDLLGEDSIIIVGEVVISLSERTRTDLDKKALAAELGDKIKQFEKSSTYQVMDVKRA